MRRLSLLALLLGCLLSGGPALADSITFDYNSGITDTMVANFWPNTDLGNQPAMYTLASGSWESQSLIRFDSLFGSGTGQIPLGSTINNATLRLYLYGVQNPTQVLGVYNISTNWGDSSTWNSLGGGITPGGERRVRGHGHGQQPGGGLVGHRCGFFPAGLGRRLTAQSGVGHPLGKLTLGLGPVFQLRLRHRLSAANPERGLYLPGGWSPGTGHPFFGGQRRLGRPGPAPPLAAGLAPRLAAGRGGA